MKMKSLRKGISYVAIILFLSMMLLPSTSFASNSGDFTNNGAPTATFGASTTNNLVMDLTIPDAWNGAALVADIVQTAGSADYWQGDALNAIPALGGAGGTGYKDDATAGFQGTEAVVRDLDLDSVYTSQADTDIAGVSPAAGTAIVTAKDADWTTLYFYDTGAATWEPGSDMIFTDDGQVYYDAASDTLEAGTGSDNVGTLTEPAGWNLFFRDAADGGAYNGAADWIGNDDDSDSVYTSAADTTVTDNADAPVAAEALSNTWTGLGGVNAYYLDSNNNTFYEDGEAVFVDNDGTFETGAFNAGNTQWLFGATQAQTDFATANTTFCDTNHDGVYDDGEAIVTSANTALESGDTVLTAGTCDITSFAASDTFSGGDATFTPSTDDIVVDLDADDVYTNAADTIVDADGTATNGADTPASDDTKAAGDPLTEFDAADNVCLEGGDTTYTGGDAIWLDLDDDQVATDAADTTVHDGTDAPTAADILYNDWTTGTQTVYADNNGDTLYTDGEAILQSADTNLDAGVLSGAGTDDLITAGTADITAFGATLYVYDDNTLGDNDDYDNGEVIITDTDTDGYPSSGDAVTTSGKAGLIAFDASDNVCFDGNDAEYDGSEVIWWDADGGGCTVAAFASGADVILVGGAGPTGTAGTEFGTELEVAYLDDDNDGVYDCSRGGACEVVVYSGSNTDFSDGDSLPAATVFYDSSTDGTDGLATVGDGWDEAAGFHDWTQMSGIVDIGYCDNSHTNAYVDGEAILQEAAAAAIDTQLETTDTVLTTGTCDLNTNWATAGTGARPLVHTTTGNYQDGDDIILENNDGELTYSGSADTEILVALPAKGTACTELDGTGNLVYNDEGGGGAWDSGEDIIDEVIDGENTWSASADTLYDIGGGATNSGDTLYTSWGNHKFADDSSAGYSGTEAIVDSADTTLNAGEVTTVSGAAGDVVTVFPNTNAYISLDSVYSSGEMILRESAGAADANIEADDVLVTVGSQTLISSNWATAGTGGRPLVHTNTAALDNSIDIILEDDDGQLTYSAAADTLIDGVAPSAGDTIVTAKDADWTTLYFYDTGAATWEAGGDMIFTDDGQVYYDAASDTLEAGTGSDNVGTLTEPGSWNLSYYDDTDTNAWDNGNDWIGTDDGGSGTYSTSADVDVYSTGGLVEDDALTDFAADCDAAGGGTNACLTTGTLPLDATESILIDDGTAGGAAPNGVVDKQADQLIGIGVQNTGTAIDTTDIAAVKVWIDGASAGWDGDETQLGGNMTVNSGDNQEWYLGGLTGAIPASGVRIFVTADIAGGATDTATLQFQLPIYNDAGANGTADQDNDEGLFVSSTNDGPQDSAILNANTQTIDTTVPTVTGVDTVKPDGTYDENDFMDINVTYTSIVNVDTGGGTPTIDLNSGGQGIYNSGSGTDTLSFRYTVADGDTSADLDYTATNAITLNGGTIKNVATNDADNTLPAVGTFAAAHAIVIDTSGDGGNGGGGGTAGGSRSTSSSSTTTTTTTTEETGLTDILNHWAQAYIEEAYTKNYVEGYEDNTFKPDQYITRAEAAKLVAMWLNMNLTDDDCNATSFSDVACSQWYGKYISYLKLQEVVEGYPDGTYGPGDYISRAEALKMLIYAKMLQGTDVSDIVNPFSDISPENWFYNVVLIGYKLSIVEGYGDGTFLPLNNITRAEFTKIFVETLLNN